MRLDTLFPVMKYMTNGLGLGGISSPSISPLSGKGGEVDRGKYESFEIWCGGELILGRKISQ